MRDATRAAQARFLCAPQRGGSERIVEEAGDGHGAHAAGHGGDGARSFFGFFEADVARQLAFAVGGRDAVDADVDDDRPLLDPVTANHLRATHRGHEDVGFTADRVVAARPRFDGEVMLAAVERPIPYGSGKVSGLLERIGDRPLFAAFGDNAFDVALLASARIGVAVRPKPRLRARAHEVAGLVELVEMPPEHC